MFEPSVVRGVLIFGGPRLPPLRQFRLLLPAAIRVRAVLSVAGLLRLRRWAVAEQSGDVERALRIGGAERRYA